MNRKVDFCQLQDDHLKRIDTPHFLPLFLEIVRPWLHVDNLMKCEELIRKEKRKLDNQNK